MEQKLSSVAKMLTCSPIQQLSYLAQTCNAINLAEGFPDFPAPSYLKDAAISAIRSDFNQYRHVQQILINQGDEVILFDPSYETYETCIRLAGGVPVYVALDPPHWSLDPKKLAKSFTGRTKAIVLNSPHNPTGKVFTRDELEIIAETCRTWDILAVTDELLPEMIMAKHSNFLFLYNIGVLVRAINGRIFPTPELFFQVFKTAEVYEHITFDEERHISIATFPGMQKRTIITSSLSKSFSVTGWRIGWAIGPACFASAIRNIHVKITDSAPAPFQEAALTALRSSPEYFDALRQDYKSKRDYLAQVDFVEALIKQAGVVAVPGCVFFHPDPDSSTKEEDLSPTAISCHTRYIRFAFCKSEETLAAASQKLTELMDGSGGLELF
ncbi:hypothetical protein BC332_17679 [Capsicum chinense]|nr:hypothetical protein BC332_17679 [Capsicum chinense]